MNNVHKDFIKSTIEKIGAKHDIKNVYEDFVLCCAYAISNSIKYDDSMEKDYLRIVAKYTKAEVDEFPKMLTHLQLELTNDDCIDILGEIYEEIGMSNKYRGQFFTPEKVCRMMAGITFDEKDVKKIYQENGYISVNDPACGSGRILFSAFEYLVNKRISPKYIFLEGDDISLLCSCMTYVSLSLMGANAIVRNKDTLTGEEYHVFITPAFAVNKELQKLRNNRAIKEEKGAECEQ